LLFFVINIFCSCFGFQNNKNIVFFLTVIRNIGLSAKAETALLFFWRWLWRSAKINVLF
jgi:hypothetical protein